MMKTPTEVLNENPAILWTPQQIGWLLTLGLVRGRKMQGGCLVEAGDVVRLWNERLASTT